MILLAEGTIGNRIKLARATLGWSQEELAEYMNTTKSMISYYENDHGDMKESLIREFAEVLKTTYEFLACGVINGAKLNGKAAEMLQIFASMDDITQNVFLIQTRVLERYKMVPI